MSNFQLSCFQLFQQYPLVKYRTAAADSRYELHVLMIGSGSRMDTLLQKVLVNGQLLDTDLYVTILTANAARSANALLTKAPYLENYAQISRNGTTANVPEAENVYCNINYCSIPKDTTAFIRLVSDIRTSGCNYVIISTGKDLQNFAYAEAISTLFASGSIISYVQNKKPEVDITSEAATYAFGFQKDMTYLEQIENIAYNLHYSYSKAINDRATNTQIQSTFYEPYDYFSNLEAAMHIQGKLECCGIDTSDNHIAAKEFATLMDENPSIINRLATLEHRRWMIEKILKGFVPVESLDMIYSGPDITTHDSNSKCHVCLVPCNETSTLTLAHWKAPAKSYPELDPLDQLSLKLHMKCGEIANSNRELIDDSLSVIQNSVERIFRSNTDVLTSMHSMELAISQMWQNKKSALPIYEGNLQTLQNAISTVNNSNAFHLKQSLSALNNALAPLKEFISFIDYKEQNRLLVRQIPFALTHKKQSVLIQLLSAKDTDSLFTTCHLEPEKVVFVSIIASHNDYLALKEHISHISEFLKRSYPDVKFEYRVLLLNRLADDHSEKLQAIESEHIHLHTVDEIAYRSVSEVLQQITQMVESDYIDITNGNPLLMVCADNTGVPVIAHTSGSMINIMNAPEIMYPLPRKTITVKEMFDLSGSVLVEESDSSVLSDLSGRYKKLYNISKNASNWDAFCKYIADFYKNRNKKEIEFPRLNPSDQVVKKTISLNTDIADLLIPVFHKLSERGYLSDVMIISNLSEQKSISFKISGNATGDAVLRKIHQCASDYTPTMSYKVTFKGKQPVITCSDLLIKNLSLPKDNKAEYKQILDGLASNNLLIDYAVDTSKQNEAKFSFQFASKDILSVIQTSGKVLEYYIYYSALLDAHFDDVEMGWHFQHTAAKDSADNELDIICTKGISSLFISAKNVSQKKVTDDANYLKYIIYEISLLADRFGINAKSALAIPEVDQFRYNDQTQKWEFSKEVKSAYSRGVYLLGKECFKGDVLGEVLDRIADGREDWCDFLKQQ